MLDLYFSRVKKGNIHFSIVHVLFGRQYIESEKYGNDGEI